MQLLVRLARARRCIEIGTFTGYSALTLALALPPRGRIVCCDLSEEWTAVARRYWKRARVAQKIDLRLGPALATLDALLARGGAGRYDFAFIDADKENYANYYERCLTLVRKGGLIAADNTLWGGTVAYPFTSDADTRAIRAFNRKLLRDRRVDIALLPIGDGLTLALKR
jgi:predicted O-methyltransferase YrrM